MSSSLFFVLRLLRSLFNPSTLALAKMSASMEPPISFVRPPRKRWKPGVVNRIGSLNYKYMNWKEFKEYYYSKMLIDDFKWIKQAWKMQNLLHCSPRETAKRSNACAC